MKIPSWARVKVKRDKRYTRSYRENPLTYFQGKLPFLDRDGIISEEIFIS